MGVSGFNGRRRLCKDRSEVRESLVLARLSGEGWRAPEADDAQGLGSTITDQQLTWTKSRKANGTDSRENRT